MTPERHFYRNWFLASRPWSFTMTFISVTAGSMMGALNGTFLWRLYLLTLLGIVALHAAVNLINDYFDVAKGLDTKETATAQYRPHPLVEGALSLAAVRRAALALLTLTATIGLYLAVTRGWPILAIGTAGLLAGVFYTAPPFRYKYFALGEASVFLMWGPLMVGGACYVQAQSITPAALLVSLPLGTLVALVILANNIRDVETDRRRGIRTVPILAGRDRAVKLYLFLIVIAYGAVFLMSLLGPLSPWSLLVLLSLLQSVPLARTIIREFPIDADARTGQMVTLFGALLLLSLILENVI